VLLNPNPVFTTESRLLCKDGSYKWISWTAYSMVDEGLIYGLVGIPRNAGKQKKNCARAKRVTGIIRRGPHQFMGGRFFGGQTADKRRSRPGVTNFKAYLETYPEVVTECASKLRSAMLTRPP